ncbi:MAG: carbamoyltransferase HypF, partial [Deltaproteobacteria bacterium]|nr:carbamoyltransferase HypF [Deltaproteobacteria bacterium]
DRELVLRRARGYAPLPVRLKQPVPALLAVGGQLKNTVAIAAGAQVFISQHIGDLETEGAFQAFQDAMNSLRQLYGAKPERYLCDLHPAYLSTQYARERAPSTVAIQHHLAHVASCMAENELEGKVLGVAWDGTGYGVDETIWGGEFLVTDGANFERVASLRRFRLPGGEKAIREPRRAALGVLYEIFGGELFERDAMFWRDGFTPEERLLLKQMLEKGVNSPFTSSAGRLFDAVSALAGLCQHAGFEGQAAMELEFCADKASTDERYPFLLSAGKKQRDHDPAIVIDWELLIRGVLSDIAAGFVASSIAAKFHNTLAELIVETALRAGEKRVVLSGGCFQNRYLSERAISGLEAKGLRPYWHQRVPPNDGGIALGQIYSWLQAHRKGTLEAAMEEKSVSEERKAEGGAAGCRLPAADLKDILCA